MKKFAEKDDRIYFTAALANLAKEDIKMIMQQELMWKLREQLTRRMELQKRNRDLVQ